MNIGFNKLNLINLKDATQSNQSTEPSKGRRKRLTPRPEQSKPPQMALINKEKKVLEILEE
ncbi:hypothetical protein DDB_G0285651 [Dictyostelium discoideum AX4]|uniref:Uncharacterized protein n=1 Tax=Dictyostelium discoideum TaxID=44689 RepID=Q54MU6_DICDI|nr:hypothetical protein DDB_G0285651 [Dictyostelium discoideum AX4]EAL64663.1 hypothetical protein DDB_G0285651 [Dictyostelium discoideum AX4]|eukprot:XP_638197.1 hypothetical protein DDB_G0285651 [Dictyostelium discoideum AX4]